MKRMSCLKRAAVFAAAALLNMAAPFPVRAADTLVWREREQTVDADITDWSLKKVLETVAEKTGWQIYVEPGTTYTVKGVKFSGQPVGRALNRLLGDLSHAWLPADTNGPAQLLIFRTSQKAATERIKAPPKFADLSKPIPNELVVTLKAGASIDELARKLGAKVIGRADELNTYRLRFDDAKSADAARSALENNPDVAEVDSNYAIPVPSPRFEITQSAAGSASPPNLIPKASNDGSKTIIGLIDTAVQKQGNAFDGFLLQALAVNENSKTAADDSRPSHGTAMWETILRGLGYTEKDGASSARILPVDVYGGSEFTSTFDVARGIYLAINNGANIINLSLGSEGDSRFLHNVITSGAGQGVLFYAAAGNEPTTAPTYPAAYPEVTAVTAGNQSGQVDAYANRGPFVDVVAPGSAAVFYNGRVFGVVGTSTSTAYASGMAAGLASGSHQTTAQASTSLQRILPRPSR